MNIAWSPQKRNDHTLENKEEGVSQATHNVDWLATGLK
jgi:hypothetical protein